jgi:hypothetical protein
MVKHVRVINQRALQMMLARKVRVKITRRSRGTFVAVLPAPLSKNGHEVTYIGGNKRECLVWLLIQLRIMEKIDCGVFHKPEACIV